MAISIGTGGYLEVQSPEVGPERPVRLLPFRGRSDTGFIPQAHFRAGEPPVAVVSFTSGELLPSGAFTGVVNGGISQSYNDTGGDPIDLSGHLLLAVVTDTGSAGPY
jgi:hypothetical protein